MRKKLFLVLAIFFLSFILVACGGNDNGERTVEDTPEEELREFTVEDLSQYDGRDGRDAYIAVDGYVYDVTDSSFWRDGSHQGRVTAGADLTEEMDNNTRHGREMLDRVPKIGILLAEEDSNDTNDELDSGSGY